MAIGHFRRSESVNHTSLEEDTRNLEKKAVSRDGLVLSRSVNDILEEKDTDSSEIESKSESESESESGDEITYYKPILIRKSGSPKDLLTREPPPSIKDIEKKILNQRIEHSLTVTKNLSLSEINIDHNYTSTDKDLLKRTLLLNDDDTIDHDLEEEKWKDRQQLRLDRERKKLVQKQLEFEERQERLLKRSIASIENENDNDNDHQINKRSLNRTKNTESKSHFEKRKRINSFKPQRVTDTTFNKDLPSSSLNKDLGKHNDSNNGSSSSSSNVNEYSIL